MNHMEQENYEQLFYQLLHAETEAEVTSVLASWDLLDERNWRNLGDVENNFSSAGNQQSDPAGAFVEKIVNSIDAVLMATAYSCGVDPESSNAPATMSEAVERLFNVPGGALDYLDARQRTDLADLIQVVAVGSKKDPNYLIVDRGEGQTPNRFPETFLSIGRSNKMRIPFVQGKFNVGGLGVLQFCGRENYQLICSRRHPDAPVEEGDESSGLWGFTLLRRLEPAEGRRSSVFVYLAPNQAVPRFTADQIMVLPTEGAGARTPVPYSSPLQYGSLIKLYSFQWSKKTVITLDARREFQRLLVNPALPYRLHESREGYRANTLSSTVAGAMLAGSADEEDREDDRLEPNFPAFGSIAIEGIGSLPYAVYVFRQTVESRDVPHGVCFLVNGQVHGEFPPNFVGQTLRLSYLGRDKGPILITVDCSKMNGRAREDFFMASRDRLRRNDVYAKIFGALREEIGDHKGVQEINQMRRQEELRRPIESQVERHVLQKLLDSDPAFQSLFGRGEHLVTRTGPGEPPQFIGRKFPTFFRLSKQPNGGLVKDTHIDGFSLVELDTDVENGYFQRHDSPGELSVSMPELIVRSKLWNGKLSLGFAVPHDAVIGDEIPISITISDVESPMRGGPFISEFRLRVTGERPDANHDSGKPNRPRNPEAEPTANSTALALPKIIEVRREDWETYSFTANESLRVDHADNDGFDFYVNVDNAFLVTELSRSKEEVKTSVRHAFQLGIVFAALAVIRQFSETSDREELEDGIDLALVSNVCNGLARVLIPIIRSLPIVPDEE